MTLPEKIQEIAKQIDTNALDNEVKEIRKRLAEIDALYSQMLRHKQLCMINGVKYLCLLSSKENYNYGLPYIVPKAHRICKDGTPSVLQDTIKGFSYVGLPIEKLALNFEGVEWIGEPEAYIKGTDHKAL